MVKFPVHCRLSLVSTMILIPAMALCSSKLMGHRLPSVTGGTGSSTPIIKIPAIQVTRAKEQKLQAIETCNVSRRDALQCLAAETLAGFAILSAKPADARVERKEMKKKVMEKLEKLRAKAGPSKDSISTAPSKKNMPAALEPQKLIPNPRLIVEAKKVPAALEPQKLIPNPRLIVD